MRGAPNTSSRLMHAAASFAAFLPSEDSPSPQALVKLRNFFWLWRHVRYIAAMHQTAMHQVRELPVSCFFCILSGDIVNVPLTFIKMCY
jgi:hypothetical protein